MKRKRGVIFKAGPSNLARFFLPIAVGAWLLTLVLSGYPVVAWAYYYVKPSTSGELAKILADVRSYTMLIPDEVKIEDEVDVPEEPEVALPSRDEALADTHWLSIPGIDVDTEILEGGYEDYEEVFRRGVWRVPDFANPEVTHKKPMILAAHRFGYLTWTNEYRRNNSFFSLPKLQEGDEIEILWGKRKYLYQVTRVEEAEEIDEYSSDLVLYTCKFLVSDLKVFVYAVRVN